MNVEPIAGKVLLKKLSIEQTAGGVIMPDIAQEAASEAEVVAIGPAGYSITGKELPQQCSVGDKVAFPKFSGKTVDVDGEEFIIMNEIDLYLIFKEKK